MLDRNEELLRQIRLGEDSVLELKSVVFRGDRVEGPGRDDLADELAAFANAEGGVCLLGVSDRPRRIEGVPIEKLDALESWVRQIANDSIQPPLILSLRRIELTDEAGAPKAVLKLDVPRSLFVHRSPGGYFRRQGSSCRELSPELLARLFQQRSQAWIIRFDEQAVPETSLEVLDPVLRRRFVRADSVEPEVQVLRKLRVLTTDDQGAERASVAGVLMASPEPERWLPSAFIEAVAYRGVDRDGHYQIDHRKITGPADRQILEALRFVRRNMRIAARKEPGRFEIPQFSLRAVFEALVNAVAHRDYSIHGSKIRLFVFDDRLELYSPGTLPNSLTLGSLALRQATRNELLTSLLGYCRVDPQESGLERQYLLEKRGEGVPIILRESTSLSGREPEFRLLDDSELMLTIWGANP
ncbi:MAG: ATP-binding protein [Thermoanaerobaculia bacterium]|nr:ATP-binding protein [Thermoanaerobaculia bacterium]